MPALEVGDGEEPAILSQGLIDGTVSINKRCIIWTFNPTGDAVTLAWHEGSVHYDSESNTVSFTSFLTGEVQTIADGDEVNVGGMLATGSTTFITERDPSCPEEVWLINRVERAN